MDIAQWAKLLIISILWGITNPFIKRGAAGVEGIKDVSKIKQYLKQILYLITRFQFIAPFILNQSGSLLYYLILRSSVVELSLAVPVVNSLTFLFTGFAGWALGENPPNKGSLFGMTLIIAGVVCYLVDKTE